MKILRIVITIIAVGFLVVAVATVDWPAVGRSLAAATVVFLVLAACATIANLTLKAVRLRLLAGGFGLDLPLRAAWRISTVGIGLGMITPGRVGELVKVMGLADRGLKPAAAFSLVVVERLFDLAIVGVFATTFAFQFNNTLGFASVGALMMATTLLIAIRRGWLSRFFPKRLRATIQSWQPASFKRPTLFGVLGLTIAVWVVEATVGFSILAGLGASVAFPKLVGLTAVTTLTAILSLLPFGAGTFDLSLITGLTTFGVERTTAVATTLDIRVISTLFPIALAFLFGAGAWRKRIQKESPYGARG